MPGGRDLSNNQRKIVNRYYQQRDAIAANNLSEIVSELFMAQAEGKGEKAVDRLWERAAKALAHTDANPAQRDEVLQSRDPSKLATLVSSL